MKPFTNKDLEIDTVTAKKQHERRIAYMAEIDMDVRQLVAERDRLRKALSNCQNTNDEYVYETARKALSFGHGSSA